MGVTYGATPVWNLVVGFIHCNGHDPLCSFCFVGDSWDVDACSHLESGALATIEGGEGTWNVVAAVEDFSGKSVYESNEVVSVEEVEVIYVKLLARVPMTLLCL